MHHARMSGNRKAAGAGAARFSARKSFHQRCAVRVTYSRNTVKGQWRAHGRYVARDSATRHDHGDTTGFNKESDALDIASALDRWQRAGDERMWKLILSPEFGERVDLRKLTRELMAQMSSDLERALEWVAVTHHNTEHPHVHIALRGIDEQERPLRLDRAYIKHGIRAVAEDLCTRQLGYRTEQDAAVAAAREVREQRYTSLDRDISRAKEGANDQSADFQIVIPTSSSDAPRLRQQHTAERLAVLEKMGLASKVGPTVWQVRRDFENVLRAMQRANDRQKTMAAHGVLVSDERLPIVMLDLKRLKSVEGRVLVHGEEESGRDAGRHYLLLEGTDAQVHYVLYTREIEDARSRGALRANSFVRLRKLFVDGKPLLEVEDFGGAEAILRNKRHLNETARILLNRGVFASEEGWGGWLGRYQAALKHASVEMKRLKREGDGLDVKARDRGAER